MAAFVPLLGGKRVDHGGPEIRSIKHAGFCGTGPARRELKGMVISRVDDLLFGGDTQAEASLLAVDEELGFREISSEEFTWCGKQSRRRADGSVAISVKAYHENLKPIYLATSRRSSFTSPLTPDERRKLRSLLGGFQWLVAQLRFDLQFPVPALQGESPTVGTILRANALLNEFLLNPDYEMVFQPIASPTARALLSRRPRANGLQSFRLLRLPSSLVSPLMATIPCSGS